MEKNSSAAKVSTIDTLPSSPHHSIGTNRPRNTVCAMLQHLCHCESIACGEPSWEQYNRWATLTFSPVPCSRPLHDPASKLACHLRYIVSGDAIGWCAIM